MSNEVIKTEEGYKVVNGNAQSVQTYSEYWEAKDDSDHDAEAWASTSSAEEAEVISPIEWE